MSGYFNTSSSDGGVRSNNINNPKSKVDVNNSNNSADILLQQLASAIQSNNNNHGVSNKTQNNPEDIAKLGIMLSQLSTNQQNTNDQQKINIGGAPLNEKEKRPLQKFFQADVTSTISKRNSYGSTSTSSRSNAQQSNNTTQSTQTITEEQQNYYTEERSLLRELLLLTMRYTNGTILRFVPSTDIQLQLLWNTNGHFINERYYPTNNNDSVGLVAEGSVRIHPNVTVVNEWTVHNTSEEDSMDDTLNESQLQVKEDLRFKSNVSHPLLGSGAHDAIALCGECGYLYSRISNYITLVLEEDVHGVQCSMSRALASRFDKELGLYHDYLITLEDELPPVDLLDIQQQQQQQSTITPQQRYLTLRSLTSKLIPIRNHLRTLAIIADGIASCNLRGGKLLSNLLRHSLDGKTEHTALVRSVACDVSMPWYKLLNNWLANGILNDYHNEFFVKEMKYGGMTSGLSSTSGYYTWHQRYVLVEGQIPLCSVGGLMDIITADLAKEVLLVGKGINFIRYCLLDKDWEVVEKSTNEEDLNEEKDDGSSQGYNFATLVDVDINDDELKCVSTLHDAVMKSSARIHSHILDSLENQHHMMHHLLALKNFMFLGQGDFVSSFVECLDQEFQGRTSIAGIYAHTLSSLLEGSLRTTTARFLPNFVLGNLRARLMIDQNNDSSQYAMVPPPSNATDGEMTPWKDNESTSIQDPWDFIYLDYKINSPLDAIVHASAMETYHQVFLFLFRLKRVEWMLNNSWRQSTALNHAILIETKAGGADAPTISEAAEHSSFLLRRISSTRQTMLHFISNLQNYLMFEVLEGGWEGLTQSLSKARSLDDVIRAHDSYLNEIVDKTFLSNDEESNTSVESLMRKLLSIALKFGKFQDHIFSNSIAGLDKAAKIRRRVEERSEKGDWGRKTIDQDEGKVFLYLADAELFEFVEKTATDFDSALSDLLKTISKQIDEVNFTSLDNDNEDTNDLAVKNHDALPFLLFRLDFSGYYARKAREMRKKRQKT